MENLLDQKGNSFTAMINDQECNGKIQVENDRVYLCQNNMDGNTCIDKLGFEYSWNVDSGTPSELEHNDITNLVIGSLIQLDYLIYPSEEKTINVIDDNEYNGAHTYQLQNSLGFTNGKAEYIESMQNIQFVQKNEDGSMTPGIQSEQLAYVLLDRCTKLNERFPASYNQKMIDGLTIFLDACQERIEDRINRDVLGKLKQ